MQAEVMNKNASSTKTLYYVTIVNVHFSSTARELTAVCYCTLFKIVLKEIGSVNSCVSFSLWLDAGTPAKSQYPDGPVTGHLVSGFSLVSLGPTANAGLVPDSSKLPLHASHVALPT